MEKYKSVLTWKKDTQNERMMINKQEGFGKNKKSCRNPDPYNMDEVSKLKICSSNIKLWEHLNSLLP